MGNYLLNSPAIILNNLKPRIDYANDLADTSASCCGILIILGIILFVAIIIFLVRGRGTTVQTTTSTSQASAQQPPPPQYQQQPRERGKPCPDCSAPMEYYAEYDRWYCDRCGEYK